MLNPLETESPIQPMVDLSVAAISVEKSYRPPVDTSQHSTLEPTVGADPLKFRTRVELERTIAMPNGLILKRNPVSLPDIGSTSVFDLHPTIFQLPNDAFASPLDSFSVFVVSGARGVRTNGQAGCHTANQ